MFFRQYPDDVVLIRVCTDDGSKKIKEVVDTHKIFYPMAVDTGNIWKEYFLVDGYPDYYIINRDGRIWAADVRSTAVRQAVKFLLSSER